MVSSDGSDTMVWFGQILLYHFNDHIYRMVKEVDRLLRITRSQGEYKFT